MQENNIKELELTKEDFVTDQIVKWCPGCGNHAILNAIERVFPKIGKRKEDILVISGIGCSSRFPYYANTYGIHGIHGRALPIATGAKLSNPNLSIWVATGDGDSMAIGGNHFIHAIRRNIDLNVILFNNKIYGLTKGQYSPTTPKGSITKTSPYGTIEHPFNPSELVIGAQGTFFARIPDTKPADIAEVMLEAAAHKGMAIVEILQNCVIFNNKVHAAVTDKENKDNMQLHLKHGEPMIFGKERNKGLILNGLKLEVVTIGENGITIDDILVHDAKLKDNTLHNMLGRMTPDDGYPMAMGVIRAYDETTYEECMLKQIESVKQQSSMKSVEDLLFSGNTWEIR